MKGLLKSLRLTGLMFAGEIFPDDVGSLKADIEFVRSSYRILTRFYILPKSTIHRHLKDCFGWMT